MTSIKDILISPVKTISVLGGDVFHAIKSTDPGFNGFSEAYFSHINFSEIKGWKRHMSMTLNLVVPIGSVKFFFIDEFGDRLEKVSGRNDYLRLTIPPKIWFAFKGLHHPFSLIMNVADIAHDPYEVERANLDKFIVNWG
jgi:dTDP-4-dehydrorhamnose 3,5-epimerase